MRKILVCEKNITFLVMLMKTENVFIKVEFMAELFYWTVLDCTGAHSFMM